MKKLLVIGLLFGSQLSYASLQNELPLHRNDEVRINVTCKTSQIVYGSGCVMTLAGMAMTINGIISIRDNADKSESIVPGPGPALVACGLPLLLFGAGAVGYAAKWLGDEAQQSQRHRRNLGDYQAMPIGEENA